MGMTVIAVHSDADARALHVRQADEAVRIGPAPASQSYLDIAAILDAARTAQADAIHSGYGFLSESAAFATAVREAGLIFVGPSAEAIAAMGDKRAAKAMAQAAGIPVAPGHGGAEQGDEQLARAAARIGWPVLIKAAAGGGGRGMRIVRDPADFAEALASARREAKSAFGDDAVLLEKLIEDGRHVEVQVFGDRFGNHVHLFERDCTAQRRHQKVVEEAPSPAVDAKLRDRLGQWAVALARAANYENAGTVEFILDGSGNPYFLEINTRLQVEHPVTEMVTGLDLVEWQLRIARGEKLPLTQDQIFLRGHAIEARLCAEDPARGFLPQTGRIERFRFGGDEANGIRVDAGVAEGDVVSANYDPMIAKIIAHGVTRDEAREKLRTMLSAAPVSGITSNGGFLVALLGSAEFAEARMTTRTIDRWVEDGDGRLAPPLPEDADFVHAAAALALASGGDWFRTSGVAEVPVDLVCGDRQETVMLEFERGRLLRARTGAATVEFGEIGYAAPFLSAQSSGATRRFQVFTGEGRAQLCKAGHVLEFREPDLLAPRPAQADPRRLVSPVSGIAIKIMAAAGDRLNAGDTVAIVEAMKMETKVCALAAGTVEAVHVAAGAQVGAGDLVAEIEPDAEAAADG
jgi:geranyl-CoA carboxylase alpha subunit